MKFKTNFYSKKQGRESPFKDLYNLIKKTVLSYLLTFKTSKTNVGVSDLFVSL